MEKKNIVDRVYLFLTKNKIAVTFILLLGTVSSIYTFWPNPASQIINQNHSGVGDNVGGNKYTNIPDANVIFEIQDKHVLDEENVFVTTYEIFVDSKYPIEVLRLTAQGQNISRDGIKFYPSNAGEVFPLRHSYTEYAGAVEFGNVAPGGYVFKISQNNPSPLQVSGEIVR